MNGLCICVLELKENEDDKKKCPGGVPPVNNSQGYAGWPAAAGGVEFSSII